MIVNITYQENVPYGELYLTLEVFAGTAAIFRDLLNDLKESVAYWRQWIPRDGMYLDELVSPLRSSIK